MLCFNSVQLSPARNWLFGVAFSLGDHRATESEAYSAFGRETSAKAMRSIHLGTTGDKENVVRRVTRKRCGPSLTGLLELSLAS